MDESRFDEMTRSLDFRLTRRHAGGLATGALLALGLAADTDAKKKKKKKKKKNKKNKGGGGSGGGGGGGVNISCANVGTPCGNTLICQCRLDKTSQQICLNGVPPNAINFQPCLSQANCPAGQYCDLFDSVCRTACAN